MSKENYEETKNFVLHNCYEEAVKYGCESEVTPFSWKSYKKYPFFNDCEYEIYFPKKGAHRTLTTHEPFFTLEDAAADNLSLGTRRQITSKGCFASKEKLLIEENMDEEEKEYIVNSWNNFKYLDLSADVITSIKSPLNKLLATFDLGKVSKEELTQMQLRNIEQYTVKCLFDKLNKWTDDKNLLELKQSIKNFCYSVGTIGNMMPIPEKSNPASRDGGGENYWSKIMSYKNIFDNKYSPKVKNKNRKKFLEDAGYKFNTDNYKLFINAFCLQDYFVDSTYEVLINPTGYNKKHWFPFYNDPIDNINKWIDWFNCNACLILKRGARIYSEGDEKIRKKLAVELISDKRFNNEKFKDEKFSLAKWYKNNQEYFRLEKLFN